MQVTEDQKLLREKVQHLSGNAGIERMECALSETRSKYFQAKENGSPLVHFISPSIPSSTANPSIVSSDERSKSVENIERPSRVVRSLFKEDDTPPSIGLGSSTSRTNLDNELGSSVEKLVSENELIVNEFLHEQRHAFADIFKLTKEDQNSVKVSTIHKKVVQPAGNKFKSCPLFDCFIFLQDKIRQTMEKAFWDDILESMKRDDPDYDRVVQLMREMRDELCQIAPDSWRQMIVESIDLDILSQVLASYFISADSNLTN